MAFTKLSVPQNTFLEQYLRGTGRAITARDAEARFGIKNLRARMTDLRNAGLLVRSEPSSTGATRYTVSSRDATGSRSRLFA